MANEKDWDKDFNWFSEEHYEYDTASGESRDGLLTFFNEIILHEWPNKDFGTAVKKIYQEKNEWKMEFRRFKTKDLCAKHCTFPPSYVRTGEMMP